MFDQKKDAKVLKVEIVKFLETDKKNSLKRLYHLLKSFKIIIMYLFAFVGFSLLSYHFILGQPYVCAKYNGYYNPNKPILSQTSIKENKTECYIILDACKEDYLNIEKIYGK
jgi:hypothetical protein